MINLEYIKKMSFEEKDSLQKELWHLISSNNIKETRNFLKDFKLEDIFYENSFDFEEEPMFNSALSLYQACLAYEKTKNFDMLNFLLSYGLKASDSDGENNVLQYCIKFGGSDVNLIGFLLDKKASFESLGKDGWSIIHNCANYQKTQALALIAKFGANMEARTDVKYKNENIKQTPLMIAAASKEQPLGEATKMLISLGVNLNAKDRNKTALDYAYDINIQLLQEAGAKSFENLQD